MAQEQLNESQGSGRGGISSQAAVLVEVLVHAFRQAENEMVRWELQVFGVYVLDTTENLLLAWKKKAATQLKLEQAEYRVQQEQQLIIQGILAGAGAGSIKSNNIGNIGNNNIGSFSLSNGSLSPEQKQVSSSSTSSSTSSSRGYFSILVVS